MQAAKPSPKKDSKMEKWATNFLFPPFSELQYFLAFSIIVVLLVTTPGAIAELLVYMQYDFRVFLYIVLLIVLTLATILPHKYGVGLKAIICFLFYLFFAVGAGFGLGQLLEAADKGSLLDRINSWIVMFFMFMSIMRAVIIGFAMRLGAVDFLKRVTTSFSDVQYKPVSFVLTVCLAIISTTILGRFYSEPVVVGVLSYLYANVLLMVAKKMLGAQIQYPPDRYPPAPR